MSWSGVRAWSACPTCGGDGEAWEDLMNGSAVIPCPTCAAHFAALDAVEARYAGVVEAARLVVDASQPLSPPQQPPALVTTAEYMICDLDDALSALAALRGERRGEGG